MIVAGGYYRETCSAPKRDEKYGSGGRAAIALSMANIDVHWHYYCPEPEQKATTVSLSRPELFHHPYTSDHLIKFEYFHPLSPPVFEPAAVEQCDSISVSGDSILRFGFMEGSAIVTDGKRVVFDPQSPNKPVRYSANGSTAERLAIVLNATEVTALGETDDEESAVKKIYTEDQAEVILVKAGAVGCRVYEEGEFSGTAPPYESASVYKVGSGDVFSATFAYYWAQEREKPLVAADKASRCTARYVETNRPSVLLDEEAERLAPITVRNKDAKVYIAGPFFTMAELWLVEQACAALADLGVSFFSPYHEAGLLGSYEDSRVFKDKIDEVVAKDLKGLEDCSAVLAILDGCDPGTIFEVGWAVRHGIPVVALSQNPKPADQTMIRGSQLCSITDDFASAIYQVAWRAWAK